MKMATIQPSKRKSGLIPGFTNRKSRGFTLLELLITLVILGVLTGLSLPFFGDMYSNYRLKKAAADFQNAVVFAKSEAVRLGQQVNIDPITTANWAGGWQVNLGPSTIIRRFDPPANINVVKAGGGTIGQISFQANGTRNDYINASTNAISFQIRFCDSRLQGREVGILVTGVSGIAMINNNCGE